MDFSGEDSCAGSSVVSIIIPGTMVFGFVFWLRRHHIWPSFGKSAASSCTGSLCVWSKRGISLQNTFPPFANGICATAPIIFFPLCSSSIVSIPPLRQSRFASPARLPLRAISLCQCVERSSCFMFRRTLYHNSPLKGRAPRIFARFRAAHCRRPYAPLVRCILVIRNNAAS